MQDILEYTFDPKSFTITFIQNYAKLEYRLSFAEKDSTTYLRVSRVQPIGDRSTIPYFVNTFWTNKIGAIPVDYTLFKSLEYFPRKEPPCPFSPL
ncbi:MAG: hypothetical protein IJX53_06765 [Clostridia bacterium]|nr:hypothetical protein [Clostridia bacterium]